MSRKSRTTLSVVEKLIEQRRLFQDWLTKLREGVEGMPPHVVERVRNDYRSRLDAVTAELSEHRDALREALDEAQQRHEGLEAQQQQHKDELAELRLRRHVGEVDDERFKEQSAQLTGALEAVKKEIGSAFRDIERYEEIFEVIAAGDAAPPAPAAAPLPEPVAVAEPAAPPPAPEPAPARGSGAFAAPRPAVDELAFLRSVTSVVGAVKGPPPPPPAPRSSTLAAAPPARKEPERVEESAVALNAAPGLLELPALEEEAKPKRASAPAAAGEASLVCKECGAVNRPTEWYCEKCGAELAAF
jgi:hypothetical protein